MDPSFVIRILMSRHLMFLQIIHDFRRMVGLNSGSAHIDRSLPVFDFVLGPEPIYIDLNVRLLRYLNHILFKISFTEGNHL